MVGYKCWHGISMHDNFMRGWWDMILGGLGRNFMNL